MTDPRVAVYCGTRNLYHQMATFSKSLIANDGADLVYFLIEDDEFTEPLPDIVRIINVSGQQYFRHDGPNFNSRWTYMVLIRAALTKLFPQYHRLLSLDTDVYINGNIDYLWDLNLDGYYFAGVQEPYHKSLPCKLDYNRAPYYNYGVVMLNLDMLRDGTDDKAIHMLNTRKLDYNEQDAMNIVCYGHVYDLSPEWNAMKIFYPEIMEGDEIIRHYADGSPPFIGTYKYRRYERMPWNEVIERKAKLHE